MAFIIIDDIGYALLTSPTVFELEKRAEYAEQQVTEGKPILQFMGQALDALSMSFTFRADFINPQKAWDDLVALLTENEAFPVSLGNGVFVGQFVLTSLSRAATETAEDGTLIGIDCRVQMKEYVDPAPLKTRVVKKKKTAKAVKKKGKKKPRAKKAAVPQLDAASKKAGYKIVDGKTIVRQK